MFGKLKTQAGGLLLLCCSSRADSVWSNVKEQSCLQHRCRARPTKLHCYSILDHQFD